MITHRHLMRLLKEQEDTKRESFMEAENLLASELTTMLDVPCSLLVETDSVPFEPRSIPKGRQPLRQYMNGCDIQHLEQISRVALELAHEKQQELHRKLRRQQLIQIIVDVRSEGMTYTRIAKHLGLKIATVKNVVRLYK